MGHVFSERRYAFDTEVFHRRPIFGIDATLPVECFATHPIPNMGLHRDNGVLIALKKMDMTRQQMYQGQR